MIERFGPVGTVWTRESGKTRIKRVCRKRKGRGIGCKVIGRRLETCWVKGWRASDFEANYVRGEEEDNERGNEG